MLYSKFGCYAFSSGLLKGLLTKFLHRLNVSPDNFGDTVSVELGVDCRLKLGLIDVTKLVANARWVAKFRG